jgi:hypothetical protein
MEPARTGGAAAGSVRAATVVHAAETYALAVLENLVHWQSGTLPRDLVCVQIAIPGDVARELADEVDPAVLLAHDPRDATHRRRLVRSRRNRRIVGSIRRVSVRIQRVVQSTARGLLTDCRG